MSFKSGRRPVLPTSRYFSRYFYGVTRDANEPFFIFPHDALRTVSNTVCATAILENEKTLGTRMRTSDNPLTRKPKGSGWAETLNTQLRSQVLSACRKEG